MGYIMYLALHTILNMIAHGLMILRLRGDKNVSTWKQNLSQKRGVHRHNK